MNKTYNINAGSAKIQYASFICFIFYLLIIGEKQKYLRLTGFILCNIKAIVLRTLIKYLLNGRSKLGMICLWTILTPVASVCCPTYLLDCSSDSKQTQNMCIFKKYMHILV